MYYESSVGTVLVLVVIALIIIPLGKQLAKWFNEGYKDENHDNK